MRALIVDDEADIGMMTKIILSKKGILADDVDSISEAKNKIQEYNYDLFLLDLNLPDGSGFDLIPGIKENNKHAGIIIISAYDGQIETQKAKRFDVDLFIKKPFSKNDIIKAVDIVLSK